MQKVVGGTPVEKLITWVGSVPSLILHTIAFITSFALAFTGVLSFDRVLLVLTTLVSLEAIYLAIFIQMTVNRQTESLREVEENIDEIQEDVEEMSEDVEDIQEDLEEIAEDERALPEPVTLETVTMEVRKLLAELEALKQKQ